MEQQQQRQPAAAMPARRPHASTSELLTWQEVPPPELGTPAKPHQPSGAIGKVVFGGQVTEEEAESLNKRKPCSAPKWKEMTGSGIFEAENGEETSETDNGLSTPNRSSRNYQAISTISHITFTEEETITPKKPTTVAEMAKQRELSGNLLNESEDKLKKPVSIVKCKELSGHDIFAPPEDPPSAVASHPSRTPKKGINASALLYGEDEADSLIKTAKKIPSRKFEDLTGNNIFNGGASAGAAEKSLSNAKLKEITGSNIFADVKVVSRDYFGGIRKPPGGESSIALV